MDQNHLYLSCTEVRGTWFLPPTGMGFDDKMRKGPLSHDRGLRSVHTAVRTLAFQGYTYHHGMYLISCKNLSALTDCFMSDKAFVDLMKMLKQPRQWLSHLTSNLSGMSEATILHPLSSFKSFG